MDRKNDWHWFSEILRIEKELPVGQRKLDNEKNLSFSNSFTEEQIDDYFMIRDRLEYLRFIRNHKDEVSEVSYLWLIEDIPNCVIEKNRVKIDNFKKQKIEAA